jgi:NADPH:quinone reductase-like Zn-dependent oxidoreductase
VSGTVDAVGEGVTGVHIGDLVFGVPDYMGYPTAGASDFAILAVQAPVPKGLDLVEAAALPTAVETATRRLDLLGLASGQTILVNGGGTTTGFAAVQIALLRGVHVLAAAGETFAGRLRDLGAKVTPYGDGSVERVREMAGGAPAFALHTA